MVVMSKLAETTQYNKTKRRQGPPKPGSAAWAAAEKNPKIAQAGRAKRGDAGAILKAGQKRASYGGWKEKPGAMKRWQDAVTKRLTWEKRNNWDGNRQSVPSTMAFSFLAQQYAVDTKAIQGACEKAMARGKFAQYVEQKGARTAVTPKELNPLNPDGLTYEPDEPELYEANKAVWKTNRRCPAKKKRDRSFSEIDSFSELDWFRPKATSWSDSNLPHITKSHFHSISRHPCAGRPG